MTRIRPLDPEEITGRSKLLIDDIRQSLGFVPTLMRLLSHSPSALAGYLALRTALRSATLPAPLRERIAIAIAAANGCDGCLANHLRFGREAGLSDDELHGAAQSQSGDPAAAAALGFARALIETRGHVGSRELALLRDAGFDDGAIVEIVTVVATNLFANLINNLALAAPDVCDVEPRCLSPAAASFPVEVPLPETP